MFMKNIVQASGSKTWKLQVIIPSSVGQRFCSVCLRCHCIYVVLQCVSAVSLHVCGESVCVCSGELCVSVCLLPQLRLLTPDATQLDGYKHKRKKQFKRMSCVLVFLLIVMRCVKPYSSRQSVVSPAVVQEAAPVYLPPNAVAPDQSEHPEGPGWSAGGP